jgi:hypothetical protein
MITGYTSSAATEKAQFSLALEYVMHTKGRQLRAAPEPSNKGRMKGAGRELGWSCMMQAPKHGRRNGKAQPDSREWESVTKLNKNRSYYKVSYLIRGPRSLPNMSRKHFEPGQFMPEHIAKNSSPVETMTARPKRRETPVHDESISRETNSRKVYSKSSCIPHH